MDQFWQPHFAWGEVRSIEGANKKAPYKTGAIPVRIYGAHDNEQNIKDEHLHYALMMQDVNNPATAKMGRSATGPVVGTRVLLMYTDEARQQPFIIGTFPRAGKLTSEDEITGGEDAIDDKYIDTPDHALGSDTADWTNQQWDLSDDQIDYTDKPKYNEAPYQQTGKGKELANTAKKAYVSKTMDLPTIAGIDKYEAKGQDVLQMISQVDPQNSSGALANAPNPIEQIFQLDNVTSNMGLNNIAGGALGGTLQSLASGNIGSLMNMGALSGIGNLGSLTGMVGNLGGLGGVVGQMSSALGTFSSTAASGGIASVASAVSSVSPVASIASSLSSGIVSFPSPAGIASGSLQTAVSMATGLGATPSPNTITGTVTASNTYYRSTLSVSNFTFSSLPSPSGTANTGSGSATMLYSDYDIRVNLCEMLNQLGGFKTPNDTIGAMDEDTKEILYEALIHLINNTSDDMTVKPPEDVIVYKTKKQLGNGKTLANTVPLGYIQNFSYSNTDPTPGYTSWSSPNGNGHTVYTQTSNTQPYAKTPTQAVTYTTTQKVASQVVTMATSKTGMTANGLATAAQNAKATAQDAGMQAAVGNGATGQGGNSGNAVSSIIGALMGLLGIIGQDMTISMSDHISPSVLDNGIFQQIFDTMGQYMGVATRKSDMAKQAVARKNQPPVSPTNNKQGNKNGGGAGLNQNGSGGFSVGINPNG